MKRALLAAVIVLGSCSGSGGNAGAPPIIAPSSSPTMAPPALADVQRISADPFTNSSSQHATQLEPSAASSGQTILAAFQTGRFFTFGSSDIGFATSFNAGLSWQTGTLPALTHYALPAGPFDSVSDPAVAYDAAHATWLIASLPILFSGNDVPGALVSRSQDGLTWSAPVDVTASNETTNDKSWITCDDHPASPFYGHCYVEWDSFEGNGIIFMSVTSDAGKTWSLPASPGTSAGGLGGQPVVQPSGTVIVPIDDLNEQNVLAFNSRNGGTTWSTPVLVSAIADHQDAANLRSFPLISAAIDAAGTVYTVWQDCRFRAGCASNDLVMSTSSDGTTWSAPMRIPIDALSSSVDHFLPGIGVEAATGGSTAQLGLTYYSYSNTNCTAADCQLFANFIASSDGGATWGAPQRLAGPMNVGWLAQTQDGAMVGDYMATAFSSGRPVALVALADPSMGAVFDEAMYVPKNGIITLQSVVRRSSKGERPVPGFHSDHPPRHVRP